LSVLDDSKKIKKRRRFKNPEEFLKDIDPKFIPEEIYDPKLSMEEKKKLIRKIRNRASAQKSRDVKGTYV